MVFEWGSLAICLVMYLVCSMYHPVRFDICRIKLIAGIQRRKEMAIQNHSNNKKLKDYIFNYNREVMLSEYISIPKARLRRLIITEVIAWGIAGFILVVTLIR
jgi:hypothetical protein